MASTSPVNDQPINFLRTPSSTSIVDNKPKFYAKRMTPEEMAEQSRIATAEGLREVAAALAPVAHRPTVNPTQSQHPSPKIPNTVAPRVLSVVAKTSQIAMGKAITAMRWSPIC